VHELNSQGDEGLAKKTKTIVNKGKNSGRKRDKKRKDLGGIKGK